jgi:hypothetical protein
LEETFFTIRSSIAMAKVIVSTGEVEQRRRPASTIPPKEGASLYSFWFFDGDAKLKLQFQKFCQADSDVPLLFIVATINVVIMVLRGCWWKMSEMNIVFYVAYPLSLILAALGLLNFNTRASHWSPLATYPLSPGSFGFRLRAFLQKLHESSLMFIFINDFSFILFPLVLNLNVLGRAMMGPCTPGSSYWDTQYCNPDGPGR